jgi:DNA-directed RNA polymerase specialized sigma24 family protein
MIVVEPDWPGLVDELGAAARRLSARLHLRAEDSADVLGETLLELVTRSRNGRSTKSWAAMGIVILERTAARVRKRRTWELLDMSLVASALQHPSTNHEPVDVDAVRARIASLRGATGRMVAAAVADGQTLFEIAESSGHSLLSVVRACKRATSALEKRRILVAAGTRGLAGEQKTVGPSVIVAGVTLSGPGW